jgi:predicted nucleotidyltransferase
MIWRDRIEPPDAAALDRVCLAYHVTSLWLFGSVLRADFHPESDIDILVEFDAGAQVGLLTLAGLQRELTRLLGRNVDLVPLRGLKPGVREGILTARQLLYAA